MDTVELIRGLIAVNLLTAVVMIYDKCSAPSRLWRIPEKSLLLLGLLGGSPTLLLMMQVLRHKTAKRSFQFKLMVMLVVQVAIATALIMEASGGGDH